MYTCVLVFHCNFSAFLSFSSFLTYFFAYASNSFFAFCDIELLLSQLWSLLLLFFVPSIGAAVCAAAGTALNFNWPRAREWVASVALTAATAATAMTLALTLNLTLTLWLCLFTVTVNLNSSAATVGCSLACCVVRQLLQCSARLLLPPSLLLSAGVLFFICSVNCWVSLCCCRCRYRLVDWWFAAALVRHLP